MADPTHAPDRAQLDGRPLMRWGLGLLRRWSRSRRYSHLFPEGPNPSTVFEAFQEFVQHLELRAPNAGNSYSPRRIRRRFRRVLKEAFKRDAIERNARVQWQLPKARPARIDSELPPAIRAALQALAPDARILVASYITGRARSKEQELALGPDARIQERRRLALGLESFRKALTQTLLDQPDTLQTIHPQYLHFTQSTLPWTAADPWRSWLLVRLPVQIILLSCILFFSGYAWAYLRFNDEHLAEFLTENIGSVIDGDLRFGKVHWGPTLALDLLIGRSHLIEVQDVYVFEGHKYARQVGGPAQGKPVEYRPTAYAEHLKVRLVLHEIIPWNRLGVPRVFNIPWILHFRDMQSLGEMWVGARAYVDPDDGREKISLIDAFGPSDDSPSTLGYRRLSFKIDDTHLPKLTVPLDFLNDSEWGTSLELENVRLRLDFQGNYPERSDDDLSLRYLLHARGGKGELVMLDKRFQINQIEELEIGAGYGDYPMGDLSTVLHANFEGSECVLSGALTDVFVDHSGVDTQMRCSEPDGLFNKILPEEEGDTGPILKGGSKGRVALDISGSLGDPLLEFHAESIDLDPQIDDPLRVRDLDVIAQLRNQSIPEALHDIYGEDRAKVGHWSAIFEHFSGQLLQGSVHAPLSHEPARLILPEHAEPFTFSGAFHFDKIEPFDALPSLPRAYRKAKGALKVNRLVFGEALGAAPQPLATPVAERFGGLWPAFSPRHGPQQAQASKEIPMDLQTLDIELPALRMREALLAASIPAQLDLKGSGVWDASHGLKLRSAELISPGLRLNGELSINPELDRVGHAALQLDVHDGASFFPSLGLPVFSSELRSEIEFSGPLDKLDGPPGQLSTPQIRLSELSIGGLEDASLQWKQGALHLDAGELSLLGGRGPLHAAIWPHFSSPKEATLRAKLELRDLAQQDLLGWPVSFSNAQLKFVVDDGAGRPRPISDIQARGHAFIPQLVMADVRYHNARAAFVLNRERIEIDELSLRYGRQLSPKLAPNLRVSTGYFGIQGQVGLSSDPSLDLRVRSSGLPLRALTNFAGGSIPVRGRIGQGSSVQIKGRVSQPEVVGKVRLASVNAANLSLGRGQLEFSSHRRNQGRGYQALDIREVRVQGQLKTGQARKDGLTIDATLAVGRDRKGREYRELAGSGSISKIPLRQLLALPSQDRWQRDIQGSLQGLSVEASYCPSSKTMLTRCANRMQKRPSKSRKSLEKNALALDLRLNRGWVGLKSRNRSSKKRGASTSCPAFASACMATALHAQLDDSKLHLQSPWKVLSGPARKRSALTLQGTFDLGSPPKTPEGEQCGDFVDRLRSASAKQPRPESYATRGEVRGAIDLSGLDPIILPLGWGPMRGRVELNLDLWGALAAPWVEGEISNRGRMLSWTLARTENSQARPLQLRAPKLQIDVHGELAQIQAQITAMQGQLDFDRSPKGMTGLALTGACRGRYSIHLGPKSKLDAGLLALLLPDDLEQSQGSIGIPEFSMRGNWEHDLQAAPPSISHLKARMSMHGHVAEFSVADQDLRVRNGEIALGLCEKGENCTGPKGDLGLSLRIGSSTGVDSGRPLDAIGIQSDATGRSHYLWGQLTMPPDLRSLHSAEISLALNQFPYRQDDNAGRPELIAQLSSPRLRLRVTPDGFQRVSGSISADKARWLRDASQGVRSVVSFADPVPAPPSTLPDSLSQLELDIKLKTSSPFRVDNNILRGLEAQAELHLGGTVGAMEVTGPIEVQQGVLDLALLGGAYVIDHGRVRLNRRIADSEVDISATRQAPVRIENELHHVTLDLDGPLDAIRWQCHSTAQRNSGLQTLRGCIDYLIFDAGNTALTPRDDVERGSLNLTRRSLTLFGNLTQVELNRFVEDELPRTGEFLPIVRGRVRQLGLELQIQTREDWFSWRWGRLGLGYSYLRGYSGSFLRDSQSLSSKLHLLEDVALEMQLGLRNYSNVALVLQPPRFGSVELGHRIRIPGLR